MKIPLRNDSEIKTFSHEAKIKEFVTSRSALKKSDKSSLGWKEIIPEGHLELQEWRKNTEMVNISVNIIDVFSSLFKICMTWEQKL